MIRNPFLCSLAVVLLTACQTTESEQSAAQATATVEPSAEVQATGELTENPTRSASKTCGGIPVVQVTSGTFDKSGNSYCVGYDPDDVREGAPFEVVYATEDQLWRKGVTEAEATLMDGVLTVRTPKQEYGRSWANFTMVLGQFDAETGKHAWAKESNDRPFNYNEAKNMPGTPDVASRM